MTARSRLLTRLLLVGLVLFVPGLALAGPNEGGTLILHANPSLVFTSDIQDYCGLSALDSCAAAVTSVPWEPGKRIVFHAVAAFPPGSSPRLKSLSFGIDYDPEKFIMAAHGSCADFELSDGTWPASGTGTSQSWTTGARTGSLTECYWFAGYAYSEQEGEDSTSIALIPHPLQHGVFVDDAFPAEVDTIAGYGRLGFGMSGHLACAGTPDGDSANEGGTPNTPGGSDSDGHDPDVPDAPPHPGGDTPSSDAGEQDCSLPMACEITENNYLICQIGADSLVYSGVTVNLTRDGADTLRLNDHPILPTRRDFKRNRPDAASVRRYGSNPRAQQLIQEGRTLEEAVATLLGERRALGIAARDRYESILARTGDAEAALDAAVEVYRSSPLVVASRTVAEPGGNTARPPGVKVLYVGERTAGINDLTPFRGSTLPDRLRSNQCRIVTLCKTLLDKHSTTAVVIIKNGNVNVKTGTVAEDYLNERGN